MARVLILEDSADFRAVLKLRLESEGFEVEAVPNGATIVELMARRPADLVITDLFMPDKDGLEIILELRERYPRTRIVAMSGWQSQFESDYLRVAREIGALHTFHKPFEMQELVRIARRLTDGRPNRG